MRTVSLLLLLTITASVAGAQTHYVFESSVASSATSGTGHDVELFNGETVFCPPDGLLGRLCPLLAMNDPVTFTGQFPTDDSDLGILGHFGAAEMTVSDAGPPLFFFPDTWSFDGCVTQVVADGFGGHLVTLTFTQTTRVVACDGGGALGALCDDLLVDDCAVFRGFFGSPLDLVEMTVDTTLPPGEGGGGPCTDCDGR